MQRLGFVRYIALLALAVLVSSCATLPAKRMVDGVAISAPPMQRSTLDNGLEVMVVENHTVPLVTIEIAVKTGAYTEPKEWDGLMHFYEHMFFKGNKALPDQSAFMKKVRSLGISFNGVTSDEAVRYYFTLPKESLEAGLGFMYDAISGPLFDPGEMEKEKGAVLAEIDRSESQIGNDFVEKTERALYGTYYHRKDVLGSREVIRAATPQTMRAIQQRFYIPNNASLIIAGDVEPAAAKKLASSIFSAWKAGPDPFKAHPVPLHPPLEKTVHVMDNKPVDIAQMRFVWHGPSAGKDPKATFAADLASVLLSQRSSGFHKRLVDSGTALHAAMGYYTLNHTGPITLYAAMQPQKSAAVYQMLNEELKRMAQPGYFTKEELARAKRQLLISELYQRERSREFALSLGFWWCVTGIDYYLGYLDDIMKVSLEDVQAYVQTYMGSAPRVEGILISKEHAEQYLQGTPWGPVMQAKGDVQ